MGEQKSADVKSLPEAIPAHPENFVFLDNEVVDKLVSTVLELSAQLWIVKRRAFVTEQVLEAAGITSRDGIETFQASREVEDLWKAEREQFVATIFAPMARQVPLRQPATPR